MTERQDDVHRDLRAFDFTLLVVGAIIGADVYVVAGLGAQFLGPAQLVAWLVAGVLAALIAVAFAALHRSAAQENISPFAPLGWGGFGAATVLIFWAYAGFELAVLPAGEVDAPRRTLPRGLIIGMAVATAFYLLTAFAVVLA